MDVVAALQASATFRGLPDADLSLLAGLAQERTYEPGTTVFLESEPAKELFLVLKGKVALEKAVVLGRRGEARRATVEVVQPGQVFGWSSLVEPRQLTASAVCVEPTRVLAFSGEALDILLRERPVTGYEFMKRVAGIASLRLRDTTGRLSYLLSTASHDLKAPLSALDSHLQALLGGYAGPLAEKQRQTLVSCREWVTEAQELLNNYLELSRLEAGQAHDDMLPLQFAEVVRRAVAVMQPAARDKGVALVAILPEALPPVRGLPLQLQQAVVNIVSNAVKFTPPGGRVDVTLERARNQLRLEVLDTGNGISDEDLPLIFDDYYRSAKVENGGAGLGLAVARRIIAAHGGRIWAESPINRDASQAKGSRLVVTLPCAIS